MLNVRSIAEIGEILEFLDLTPEVIGLKVTIYTLAILQIVSSTLKPYTFTLSVFTIQFLLRRCSVCMYILLEKLKKLQFLMVVHLQVIELEISKHLLLLLMLVRKQLNVNLFILPLNKEHICTQISVFKLETKTRYKINQHS